jgi:hypothetical protein
MKPDAPASKRAFPGLTGGRVPTGRNKGSLVRKGLEIAARERPGLLDGGGDQFAQ